MRVYQALHFTPPLPKHFRHFRIHIIKPLIKVRFEVISTICDANLDAAFARWRTLGTIAILQVLSIHLNLKRDSTIHRYGANENVNGCGS